MSEVNTLIYPEAPPSRAAQRAHPHTNSPRGEVAGGLALSGGGRTAQTPCPHVGGILRPAFVEATQESRTLRSSRKKQGQQQGKGGLAPAPSPCPKAHLARTGQISIGLPAAFKGPKICRAAPNAVSVPGGNPAWLVHFKPRLWFSHQILPKTQGMRGSFPLAITQ